MNSTGGGTQAGIRSATVENTRGMRPEHDTGHISKASVDVFREMARARLRMRGINPDDVQLAKSLYKSGWNMGEVAAVVGEGAASAGSTRPR